MQLNDQGGGIDGYTTDQLIAVVADQEKKLVSAGQSIETVRQQMFKKEVELSQLHAQLSEVLQANGRWSAELEAAAAKASAELGCELDRSRRLHEENGRLREENGRLLEENGQLCVRLGEATFLAQKSSAELAAIKQSTSWRVTGWLRFLSRLRAT